MSCGLLLFHRWPRWPMHAALQAGSYHAVLQCCNCFSLYIPMCFALQVHGPRVGRD